MNKNIPKPKIEDYLESINKFPLLEEKKEIELQNEASKGNKNAKKELFNHNLLLVVSVAKKLVNLSNLGLMDLIKEGEKSLTIAIEKYSDESMKPSSYYIWWIKSSLLSLIFKNIFSDLVNCGIKDKKNGNTNEYLSHFFLINFIKNTFFNLDSEDLDIITKQTLLETSSTKKINNEDTNQNFILKSPYFIKLLK